MSQKRDIGHPILDRCEPSGGGGDDSVAGHDCGYAGDVDWAFGVDGGGEVAEVLRAHEAGGEDAHHARGGFVQVGVAVRDAARDVKLLAGADLMLLAVEGPGGDAVDADDGFVVVAMEMSDVEIGLRRDGQLEEVEFAVGFVAALEKRDAQVADANGLVHERVFLYKTDDYVTGKVAAILPQISRGPCVNYELGETLVSKVGYALI
jgi:hypothetical protein